LILAAILEVVSLAASAPRNIEAAENRQANEAVSSRLTRLSALSENRERAAQGIDDAISFGLAVGARQRSMQHVIVRAVIKKNKQITMGARRF
jgi:hypothetical protein